MELPETFPIKSNKLVAGADIDPRCTSSQNFCLQPTDCNGSRFALSDTFLPCWSLKPSSPCSYHSVNGCRMSDFIVPA